MAAPTLQSGSESCVPTQKDLTKIESAEIKILKKRYYGCSISDKI